MRKPTSWSADLRVPHLFRRWDLTEGDRFDWSLHPTWKSTERRPSHVLAVRMAPNWRGEIEVTLEAHVIRKDGKAGVKGTDVRLGDFGRGEITDPQIPDWVLAEAQALAAFLVELQDAVKAVQAEHGLTDDA